MKGYKAFKKGLICRDKQYAENTVFEEGEAVVCQKGMHFCKEPLDVLNHYPLVDENGEMSEFAEVEALDEPVTDDNKKYCSKKLKIGAKLSFAKLVQVNVDFEWKKTEAISSNNLTNDNGRDYAQIGSSGDYAKIGSSGYSAQIGSSGYSAQIGSSGDYAQIGSSGDYAQIGSSGDSAKIGSSGYSVQIGSSGYSAQIGSSGDSAKIGSSGDSAKIGSSGDSAQIGSSGYSAQIGSSGDYAQIGSSGDYAKIGSSGYSAQIGSSGDYAQINSTGKHSVICCAGNNCFAKGKIGSWITLSEWKYAEDENCYIPVCVKTEKIDGDRIKEDTYYKLENGEFVEVCDDEL